MTSCHREWLDRFCHRDMTWTNPSGSCLFSLPRLLCCSRYVKVPVNADYDAVSTSSSQKSSNSSLGLRGQSLSAVCLSMTAVVVLPVVCHRPTHHIIIVISEIYSAPITKWTLTIGALQKSAKCWNMKKTQSSSLRGMGNEYHLP